MEKIKIFVDNDFGEFPERAASFVEAASKYKSEIFIEKEDTIYNAKSILGVLSLGAIKGDIIYIKGEGEDVQEALVELSKLFEGEI